MGEGSPSGESGASPVFPPSSRNLAPFPPEASRGQRRGRREKSLRGTCILEPHRKSFSYAPRNGNLLR